MRRFEVTCDACDLVEHINLRGSAGTDLLFDGWIAHRAVVYENGAEAYEVSADLCPECAEKMRHALSPANWPRIKAAPRDQPLRSVA